MCITCFNFVASYLQQVADCSALLSDAPALKFIPGDKVWSRDLEISPYAPRFSPPVEVLLVTRTAVKVKGQPAWIHTSRIRAAPEAETDQDGDV